LVPFAGVWEVLVVCELGESMCPLVPQILPRRFVLAPAALRFVFLSLFDGGMTGRVSFERGCEWLRRVLDFTFSHPVGSGIPGSFSSTAYRTPLDRTPKSGFFLTPSAFLHSFLLVS